MMFRLYKTDVLKLDRQSDKKQCRRRQIFQKVPFIVYDKT
jgi:hypothetical protein